MVRAEAGGVKVFSADRRIGAGRRGWLKLNLV